MMLEQFLPVLLKALQGWLSVFVVTIVIVLVISLLNCFTSRK